MTLNEMKDQITKMQNDLQEIMSQLDNKTPSDLRTEIANTIDETTPHLRKARQMISSAKIDEQMGR